MNKFTSSKRLIYLETARGIASVIVVFHHFLLGFFPPLKEYVTQGGLKGTPLYLLVNGTGAVAFFFALSGFVLTQKFYQQFSMPELAASVLKRLPRLMLPAGLSMMIGAVILIYYSGAYAAAAQLTGSNWLATFARAGLPDGFVPSFSDAAQRSLLVFFLPNHDQYNSNLWTMVYEFYGSLLAFGLVATGSLLLGYRYSGVIALHAGLAVLFLVPPLVLFLPFVIGSLIAFLHCKRSFLSRLPAWAVALLAVIMIAGYSFDNRYALILAATATMLLLLGVPSLEQRLSGPAGLFLGRLSFPLYLVHVLVMLSVTSAAYVALIEYGMPLWGVLTVCFALTWVVSLLASLPFMTVERVWVRALNGWSRALVRRVVH